MAGIIFSKSKSLPKIKDFYLTLGAKIWLDQTDCIIFKHDNFLFGFCSRGEISSGWLMTFFYESKEEVDQIYKVVEAYATEPPTLNEKYNIYHFFAKDPEGRDVEFQAFLHDLDFDWNIYR
jgi:hypothetical protein